MRDYKIFGQFVLDHSGDELVAADNSLETEPFDDSDSESDFEGF